MTQITKPSQLLERLIKTGRYSYYMCWAIEAWDGPADLKDQTEALCMELVHRFNPGFVGLKAAWASIRQPNDKPARLSIYSRYIAELKERGL